MNSIERLNHVKRALAGARLRESDMELGSAIVWQGGAILSLVSVAMLDFQNRTEVIAFLFSHDAPDIVQKYEMLIGQESPSQEPGIFVQLGVAHVGSLLGLHDAAEYLISRAQWPGRHFWNEYARAMQCLATKQPYEPKLGKLIGSQKYWAAYLPFISDITNGRDLSGSLEVMRQSFQKRQADKRITDDGGLIVEGSAKQPTHWDFRAEAIKAYATYKYGLTFPS